MEKRKVYSIQSQHEIMVSIGEGFIILDFFNVDDDKYYYHIKFDGHTSEWIDNYVPFLKEINKSWSCCDKPQIFEEKYLKKSGFIQVPTIDAESNEIVKWN